MMSIEETLAQRQKTHGDFSSHAAVSQAMKNAMRHAAHEAWNALAVLQLQIDADVARK